MSSLLDESVRRKPIQGGSYGRWVDAAQINCRGDWCGVSRHHNGANSIQDYLEIAVTARRRSESVQDVQGSGTATTTAALKTLVVNGWRI